MGRQEKAHRDAVGDGKDMRVSSPDRSPNGSLAQAYQLMPPLSHVEMAELRASIEAHGVQMPVIVDENGVTIDGHHRRQIALELGIEYPHEVREGLSDEQKRMLALTLNTKRRMLTREQMREVIAKALQIAPERSDNAIAKDLGVSHHTVADERKVQVDVGTVANVAKRTDTKGRQQPATKPARKPAARIPPPPVERAIPPEAVRDPLRAFYASFETHRKELEVVFAAEIDKLGRYAHDPYVVSNVKRVLDKIRKALDAFRSDVGAQV